MSEPVDAPHLPVSAPFRIIEEVSPDTGASVFVLENHAPLDLSAILGGEPTWAEHSRYPDKVAARDAVIAECVATGSTLRVVAEEGVIVVPGDVAHNLRQVYKPKESAQ